MHETTPDLLDKIEMRFIEGEYDKENGLHLFALDIQEAKESYDAKVIDLDYEIEQLERKLED